MPGFVRRFATVPPLETLLEIEGLDIIDQTPPAPATGVGSGTLCVFGEFEDGPFAAGGDSDFWDGVTKGRGPAEVFGADDIAFRFGGFGFTYGSLLHRNPAARRHLSELWNGNGFLKMKFNRAKRVIFARPDTSVGSVAFSQLAMIEGGAGPFALAVGQQLSVTTNIGGPAASTALAAVVATVTGVGGTFPTLFTGGQQIGITIDSAPEVIVTFAASDQALADVVARINLAFGYTAASISGGQLRIVGIVPGTSGRVVLRDVTAGTLATLGHTAGTTAGTGNVGNINAVTATELAALLDAVAAWIAVSASAAVGPNGRLRIFSDTPSAGTVLIVAGAMATALGLTTGVTVAAGVHAAGSIPAGTRVRTAGGAEWVTMQTLTIPEGTTAVPVGGPYTVKVRPATDDGSGLTTGVGTVVVVVDQPTYGLLTVTNPAALTAALTEPQMDVAYERAIDATIDPNGVSASINYTIAARQSDAVRAKLRQNAIDASDAEHDGRKTIVSAPLGYTQTQAQTQVAALRHDRLFYTWPGWKVRIPEIAEVGIAGGAGFTDDGVITVRADGPLATIDCLLPPEENPGQDTDLIDAFSALEDLPGGVKLGLASYIALKAAGICAPRRSRRAGSIYQSGVTSSLTAGRITQARRKMADFIQDSLGVLLLPDSKKLNKLSRRQAVRATTESFLSGLLSQTNPTLQRIDGYSIDEVTLNTAATIALGLFFMKIQVRTLPSLDKIVLVTEIGEGVVLISEEV